MDLARRGFLPIGLALAALAAGVGGPMAQADPLPSWNEGRAKTSILHFVGKVTKEGAPISSRRPSASPPSTTTGRSGPSSPFTFSSLSRSTGSRSSPRSTRSGRRPSPSNRSSRRSEGHRRGGEGASCR